MAFGKAPYMKPSKFGPGAYDDLATGESVWKMLNVETPSVDQVEKPDAPKPRPPSALKRPLLKTASARPKGLLRSRDEETPLILEEPLEALAPSLRGLKPLDPQGPPPAASIAESQPGELDEGLAESVYLRRTEPSQPSDALDLRGSLEDTPHGTSGQAGLLGASPDAASPQSGPGIPWLASAPSPAKKPPYVLIYSASVLFVFLNAVFLQFAPGILGKPVPSNQLELRGPVVPTAQRAPESAPAKAPGAALKVETASPAPASAPLSISQVSISQASPQAQAKPIATKSEPAPLKVQAPAPPLAQGTPPVAPAKVSAANLASAKAPPATLAKASTPTSKAPSAGPPVLALAAKPPVPASQGPASHGPASHGSEAPQVALAPPHPAPAAKPAAIPASSAPLAAKAPAASQGGQLVQVGAFASSELANDGWVKVSAAMGAQMTGKSSVIQPTVKDGKTLYRSLIGGFSAPADAESFCAAVKAKGIACFLRR